MNFRNKFIFYGELLAPRQTPKVKDHPLSAVSAYLIYSQLPSKAYACVMNFSLRRDLPSAYYHLQADFLFD
jgi:hypothetical protein